MTSAMFPPKPTSEAAFECVIEAHLLGHGYATVAAAGFDRERAIFPDAVLDFIRNTQPKEWAKLEGLHGVKTGEQVLADLCEWMDSHGCLATLRHGFLNYPNLRNEVRAWLASEPYRKLGGKSIAPVRYSSAGKKRA